MESKTFYRWTNQGVIAVVPEHTFKLMNFYGEFRPGTRGSFTYPTPIFTFTNSQRALVSLPYVTGDYQMLDLLVGDHIVIERSFYVPFSSSVEINGSREERLTELRFCASFEQMVEAFGIENVMKAAQALVPLDLPRADRRPLQLG
jgi:hypothetical protein